MGMMGAFFVSAFNRFPFVASVLSFRRNLVVACFSKHNDEIPPER
jgi:hypothetical protein